MNGKQPNDLRECWVNFYPSIGRYAIRGWFWSDKQDAVLTGSNAVYRIHVIPKPPRD